MPITRPALPESLPTGTPVWVRRSPNASRGNGGSNYIEARIVSAARIWVKIEAVDGSQTWRMRRDSQDEATQYSGNNYSFLTEAQYAYRRRLDSATAFLAEQGIRIERGPWHGRQIELADALRTALGLS